MDIDTPTSHSDVALPRPQVGAAPGPSLSSVTKAPVVVWFRRDLRLDFNPAIAAAEATRSPMVAVYVVDPVLWNAASEERRDDLMFVLAQLDSALLRAGSRLMIRRGDPVVVIPGIVDRLGAQSIFWNDDVSPYARRRDERVRQALSGSVHVTDGNWVCPPGSVRRANGLPYQVFTPFYRRWREHLDRYSQHGFSRRAGDEPANATRLWVPARSIEQAISGHGHDPDVNASDRSAADDAARSEAQHSDDVGDPGDTRPGTSHNSLSSTAGGPRRLGDPVELGVIAPGARQWWLRPGTVLAAWQAEVEVRGGLSDSFADSLARGAHLSPALKWGVVSAERLAVTYSAEAGAQSLIRQLAWRDFFADIMFHHPETTDIEFKAAYRSGIWHRDGDLFTVWKTGMTGYPLIDAAMRELAETGWMHNRLRMVTASFLVKHLLIDWRLGERYFRSQLNDGDVAQNVGNWQWVAGCGVDAAPYFRIFQPVRQARRFDPEAHYVRRWIPELAKLDPQWCFEPWKRPDYGTFDDPALGYPSPIIDLAVGRERALQAYSEALGQASSPAPE